MTAAVITRRASARRGLLRVNSLRDMAPLADLMESAFGHEVDPDGQRLIREMRAYGRAGIVGWLAGRFVLPPAAYPMGYVWYEDGRLVGNASILPVEGGSARWVLANVAVQAEFRRRGIGREMVRASLAFAELRGASETLLQVETANEAATTLYRELGFQKLSERTTYRRSHATAVPENLDFGLARERKAEEWKEAYELALAVCPEGVVWPMPLRQEFFRGQTVGGMRMPGTARHWIWIEHGKILASLTARPDWDGSTWRLVMITLPEARGKVENGLVSCGLAYVGESAAIVLDYTSEAAVSALQELGFRADRRLTWMSRSSPQAEGGIR